MNTDNLYKEIIKAQFIAKFKNFCIILNQNEKEYITIKKILSKSNNKAETIEAIFNNRYNISLNKNEAYHMEFLINGFFNKKIFREKISISQKKALIKSQNEKCAFCGTKVTIHDHADHIIPFIYVGDTMNDINLQMLCSTCNQKKNSSIDYQIRFWLGLV